MTGEPASDGASHARRAKEQATLYRFTDRLYRAGSLADVYEAALDAILSALRCDRASILLFDDAGVMRFIASRGLSAAYQKAVDGHAPWRPGDRHPEPIFVDDIDAADEPDALKAIVKAEGIRALGFVPLTANGVVIGKFMTYYDAPHVFSDDEVDLALIIARQLGFSIERERSEEARRLAEARLRRNEERLRQIIDSAREYAIITLDAEGRIASWNKGAERLLGYEQSEILGQSGEVFFRPEDRAAGIPDRELRAARADGRAANERWHVRKDGSCFWGSGVMLPVEDGAPDAFVKIFRDSTEERRAEERQRLLIAELNHRVKNTLAAVQSLADQTLKSAATPEAFASAFQARVLALAAAHDLLTREAWHGADMAEIAHTILQTWAEDGRASISGPSVRVSPKQALAVAMAFNELMTNAVKHGALSVPHGRVSLSWTRGSGCEIQWVERGGPTVSPPKRQGFGLRVLGRALTAELGKPVELRFEPAGVRCSIHLDPEPGVLPTRTPPADG